MGAPPFEMHEEDRLRADMYALLGRLLARPPSGELLRGLAALGASPSTPIGKALAELAERAGATSEAAAEREYNALFIGVDRGELVPYASYYLTGFLHDRPLARVRQDMQALGIERVPGVSEPEDHIASLCETMAGLIRGAFDAPTGLGQDRFFARHLAPWAGRFFENLEKAGAAVLYRPIGTIGRLFVESEEEAWTAAAPAAAGPADRAGLGAGVAPPRDERKGPER